jgi:hypothetical protein
VNTIFAAYGWCIVQVTLIASAAGCAYGMGRWFRSGGLTPLLTVSLSAVGTLTLLSISPWPRWDFAIQWSENLIAEAGDGPTEQSYVAPNLPDAAEADRWE